MPNDFIGELSKARLLDLVKPLLNRKNSGMVLVRGTEIGELHIEGVTSFMPKTAMPRVRKPFLP